MSDQRTLTIETAADLERGDVLTDDGRDLVVTALIPATREEALAYGAREVQSGSWSRTYDAAERITAAPGRARLHPRHAPADRVLAAVAAVLTQLGDVRHDRVIMAAAVLASRGGLTPAECADQAANGGPGVDAAWDEGKQLLAAAEEPAAGAQLAVRCQVGRCTNQATGVISACGTVHACDDCHALVDQLTAAHNETPAAVTR